MTGWDDDIFTNQAYTTNPATYTYFDESYFYYPLSYINKNHLDTGNKIIMPQSALEKLLASHDDIDYPMLFQIQNTTTGQHSHCGVMEFTAEEGFVYLPSWMRENLQLQECDSVNIRNICLPKGTYIKIQPHTTKFTTLPNHKAILENSFRDFACLTTGDTIIINHGEDKYMIDILETKPAWGVSLFETDCEVDFVPPLDYKEPEKISIDDVNQKCTQKEERSSSPIHDKDTKLFPGIGRRLASDDRCCFSIDESLKKLKITESTKTIDEKVQNKYSTELRPPFVRRVDGQALVVAEKKVAQDQVDAQVNMKKRDEGFKPFTGRSFRLV